MATVPETEILPELDFPTSDGRPVAETDTHYKVMKRIRDRLSLFYANDPKVYVSGNLIVCYDPTDRRKHVAPDIFVVKGVSKDLRRNYLVWKEGKPPDLIIELTSYSTWEEDLEDKYLLYQNVLRVPEYFLFDPQAEYLKPPLQGYRLREGGYVRIEAVQGRLPSEVLGLHLERHEDDLRLYDPTAKRWLLAPEEVAEQAQLTLQEFAARLQRLETDQQQMQDALKKTEAALKSSETENQRLQREIDELRRRLPEGS
jgi:Uma2 family endonuclease